MRESLLRLHFAFSQVYCFDMVAHSTDWLACTSCFQVEQLDPDEELAGQAVSHEMCSGIIFTSLDESMAKTIESNVGPSIDAGINLQPLFDRPEQRVSNVLSRRGIGRRVRVQTFTRDELLAERLGEIPRARLGSLSEEQTASLVKKFRSHLVEVNKTGCQTWGGPKSLRVFAKDGSTRATHSPLSVATFLNFGRVLASPQVFRECNHSECFNPEHLTKQERLPEVVSSIYVMSQLMSSLKFSNTRQGCVELKNPSQNILLRKKGSSGFGQRTISVWKVIYYLAFGEVAKDLDRVRVWQACGFFACVNPSHLELERRSSGSDFRGKMLFYKFAAQFLPASGIDIEDCVPLPGRLAEETARQVGTVSVWRYWSPFGTGAQGDKSLDKLACIAALSLDKLGWAFYPAYGGVDESAIACPSQSDCINPHHVLSQILERSLHSWHRHSFVTDFKFSPVVIESTFHF